MVKEIGIEGTHERFLQAFKFDWMWIVRAGTLDGGLGFWCGPVCEEMVSFIEIMKIEGGGGLRVIILVCDCWGVGVNVRGPESRFLGYS